MRKILSMEKKNSYQVFVEEAPKKLKTIIRYPIVKGGNR
jgi:hypothetical protein